MGYFYCLPVLLNLTTALHGSRLAYWQTFITARQKGVRRKYYGVRCINQTCFAGWPFVYWKPLNFFTFLKPLEVLKMRLLPNSPSDFLIIIMQYKNIMHGHMRQYCDQLQCGQWYAVVECGVEKVTKVPGKCMIFFLREEFTPMLSSTVESFRCAYWCLSTFEPIRRHVSRCQCQCYLFRVYLTL